MNQPRTAAHLTLALKLLFGLAFVFLAALILGQTILSKDIVSGTSMAPTLKDGDRLYSLRHKPVHRSDIVVIEAPDRPDAPGTLYIKRVIGMPGDTITVANDQLYINGKKQAEPYLNSAFMQQAIKQFAIEQNVPLAQAHFTSNFSLATLPETHRARVPAGHYFVMGDNRLVSHDGRAFGFIAKSKVQSVVVWRYWPLSKMTIY